MRSLSWCQKDSGKQTSDQEEFLIPKLCGSAGPAAEGNRWPDSWITKELLKKAECDQLPTMGGGQTSLLGGANTYDR